MSAAELEQLLRGCAAGPPSPSESAPWEFLLREPEAALQAQARPLVSGLLLDGNPLLRLRALEFVMNWRAGAERTLPRLVEIAERHADQFAEQTVEGSRLRERLQHAIANQCPPGAPLAATLLQLTDERLPSPAAAAVIAAHDPEQAARIATRPGDEMAAQKWRRDAVAAVALYRRDALLAFLSSPAAIPERESLAAEAERAIERDDARLRKLTAKHGLSPPAQTAPSSNEIRRALDLDR